MGEIFHVDFLSFISFFFLVSNACAFAYIFSTVISSDDTEPSSKAKTEINI